MGYNFLIQGTGSDCTSRAFYLVSEWLKENRLGRGLFTVHDELLVECKEEVWQDVEAKILDTMAKVGQEIGLTIPLKGESSGPMPRWLD
jgi:DNA polymerase I-like protein with 3'-5' exonuclease and polymerase domains